MLAPAPHSLALRNRAMTNGGGPHGPKRKKASPKAGKKTEPVPLGKRKMIPAKLRKAKSG